MPNKPSVSTETLIFSTYYAPRGRKRLYALGRQLSQRYMSPTDLLIGIIGSEGSGKSTLIRGMYPGLELTNDDDGVNVTPTPIYSFDPEDFFSPHTFHIDARYELAFHQKYEIIEAINFCVQNERRVIVEHFDLLYKDIGYNAQVLVGIGEEVVVARPSVFGPFPNAIKNVVDKTIKYRRMAHSAEDITACVLAEDYGYETLLLHSDVKHGFVINFADVPDFDIKELEEKVLKIIEQDLPIKPTANKKISVGKREIPCTGTRTHVKTTGQIKNFRLKQDLIYDGLTKEYLLVGVVGQKEPAGFEDITESLI